MIDPATGLHAAVAAALHAAADDPNQPIWRDPAGDIVGPAEQIAGVAIAAYRRELIAKLTRDSIDMGLYDLPAPKETP